MQLTPNFDLTEFTTSQTAARTGLDNIPGASVLANLQQLALQLEHVRVLLGASILISSGYRSPELNKLIGGAKASQHTTGHAVDFTAPKFGTPRKIVEKILESGLEFDQVILEFDRWVHFSFVPNNNRQQALIINTSGTNKFS